MKGLLRAIPQEDSHSQAVEGGTQQINKINEDNHVWYFYQWISSKAKRGSKAKTADSIGGFREILSYYTICPQIDVISKGSLSTRRLADNVHV